MARLNAEVRRQELMEIAFNQFTQNGYEKTSIRSIVGEAGGEIGMFYHHFASKDDIFQAVLEEYNQRYVTSVKEIVAEHEKESFWEVMKYIFEDLEQALKEYKELNGGNSDSRVLKILHQSTVDQLVPCFCELLEKYCKRGEVHIAMEEVETTVNFVLYGTSAVIHMKNGMSLEQKYEEITKLLKRAIL